MLLLRAPRAWRYALPPLERADESGRVGETQTFPDSVNAQSRRRKQLLCQRFADLIDEHALIAALECGKVAAFGADVLHNEWRADMGESPLVQYAQDHDNVIITPHLAGCTDTSLWHARIFSARKLAHYLVTGEELTM